VAAQATKLHMKYTEQGRFCCGVASVQLNDGTEEGRRCYSFDYTGCNVVTITIHEKMVKDEIRRVKILPHGGLWLEDRRVEGAIYEGDKIKKTTNIGIAKVRCSILSCYGIVTIGDLKNMSAHTKQQIVEERKMTSDLLMKLQYNVKDAILGDAPAKFDHRKTDNPYESMYGDEWNVEILKTAH
jgi:hypothetical protein